MTKACSLHTQRLSVLAMELVAVVFAALTSIRFSQISTALVATPTRTTGALQRKSSRSNTKGGSNVFHRVRRK
jgi:hypothetical protein